MSRLALLVLVGIAGCGEAAPESRIVLGLATDFPADALSEVRLVVRRGAAEETVDLAELPASLSLPAAGGPLDVTAIARFGDAELLRREVVLDPPDGEHFLRLALLTGCLAVVCGPGETCIEGSCAPRSLDGSGLPGYRDRMEYQRACPGGGALGGITGTGEPCGDGEMCREGVCYPRPHPPAERVRLAAPTLRAVLSPWAVAAADFDMDGRCDLAVTNFDPFTMGDESGGVTVLVGDGGGNLREAAVHATTGRFFALAAADLDGDGRADLAYTNGQGSRVEVLLGAGDGSFRVGGNFAVFQGAARMAAGDFDRDGTIDLVATSPGYGLQGAIALLLGVGGGSFKRGQLPVVSKPWGGTVADLDGDGRLDLAFPCWREVDVLSGSGSGRFEPPVAWRTGDYSTTWLVSGDVDGDGHLDLVAKDDAQDGTSSTDIRVLIADGSGGYRAARSYEATAWNAIALADLDGDGYLDVVATGSERIAVRRGVGDGTLGPEISFDAGGDTVYLVVRDFDSDGHPDVAFTGGPNNPVVGVMMNRSE